jgi:hypothetical protein
MVPGEVLGNPHIDRNMSTYQVYESHNALWLEDRNGNVFLYKPIPGKILWFTCEKAHIITKGVLPELWHFVRVPKDYIPTGKIERRDSIVFFHHEYEPGIDRLKEFGDGMKTEEEMEAFRQKKAAIRAAQRAYGAALLLK